MKPFGPRTGITKRSAALCGFLACGTAFAPAWAQTTPTSDTAFLTALSQAIDQAPTLREPLIRAATQIKPNLSAQIEQMAASGLVREPSSARVAPRLPPAPASRGGGTPALSLTGLAAATAAAILGGTVAIAAVNDETEEADGPLGSVTPAPPPSPPTPGSEFVDDEFNRSRVLPVINASAAYAAGGTGKGVTVAFLTQGYDYDHPDLQVNLAPGGYDFVDDDADPSPATTYLPDGTGPFATSDDTGVAGLLAAARNGDEIHGVAYEAKHLPIRVITDHTEQDAHQILNSGLEYILDQRNNDPNIAVALLSTDQFSAGHSAEAVTALLDAGLIVVGSRRSEEIPLGGSNAIADDAQDATHRGELARLPLTHGTQGRFVTAGCYDPSTGTTCAGYRLEAGPTKDYFLLAPALEARSTYAENGVPLGEGERLSTTPGYSTAAAQVAGAVAILRQLYPELEPEDIVSLLLESATDLGTPGIDDVYGRGLLNLDRAVQPMGTMTVASGSTVSGPRHDLAASRISLSPAFGDGLASGLAGKTLAVFDAYDRAFLVDLGQFAEAAKVAFDMDAALHRFAQPDRRREFTLPSGATIALTTARRTFAEGGEPADARTDNGRADQLTSFSLSQRFGRTALSASYNLDPRLSLGLWSQAEVGPDTLLAEDAFASPYLGLVEDSIGTAAVHTLAPNLTLTVGAYLGEQSGDAGDETSRTSAAAAELVFRPREGLRIGLEAGGLGERGRFLGAKTEGAFATGEESWTGYAGLSLSYDLTARFTLLASAHQGFTHAALAEDSVIDGMSTLRSESYAIGLIGRDLARDGDRMMIGVSQPLRVADGTAILNAPVGRDLAGNVLTDSVQSDLAPSAREMDVETSYALPLGPGERLTTGVMLRLNPGHVDTAQSEGIGLLRYQARF